MLIDLAVDTVVDGLTETVATCGNTYVDDIVEHVFSDEMMNEMHPDTSLYVLGLDGYPSEDPKDFESGQAYPTFWYWPVQIQVRVRSGDLAAARERRRTIIWRVVREIYRSAGLGGRLRVLSESADGVRESVITVKISDMPRYQDKDKAGRWLVMGAVTLLFKVELHIT